MGWQEMPDEGRITDAIQGPCAWCGQPSDSLYFAVGVERELPLHPTCGLAMIYAHRRWQRGALVPGTRKHDKAVKLFGPMPAQLGPGSQGVG